MAAAGAADAVAADIPPYHRTDARSRRTMNISSMKAVLRIKPAIANTSKRQQTLNKHGHHLSAEVRIGATSNACLLTFADVCRA